MALSHTSLLYSGANAVVGNTGHYVTCALTLLTIGEYNELQISQMAGPMAHLFDMHIHTTKGSSDSNLSPEEMVLQAEQLGLFGLCITEHSGPWDKHDFQRFASQHNVILIRAMEVETDMGHILAFGMDQYLSGINKASNLRHELNKVDGFMVSAHPFRDMFPVRPKGRPLIYQHMDHVPSTVVGAAEHPIFSMVDAVEAANGATSNIENDFAVKVARHLGLKVTGGSDAHSRHGLGRCVTEFKGEIHTAEEFMNSLHNGSFAPAVLSPNGSSLTASWTPVPEPFTGEAVRNP